MKMMLSMIGSLALVTAGATPALAGDAAAGAQKSAICGACHGATGKQHQPGMAEPGGPARILHRRPAHALQAGHARQPAHDAECLHALGPGHAGPRRVFRKPDTCRARGRSVELQGRRKALSRRRSRAQTAGLHRLPRPEGKGNAPARYPALRSQHAVYTFNQLKTFAEGRRLTPGNDIMQVVASRLTEDEMRALASYTQGLR